MLLCFTLTLVAGESLLPERGDLYQSDQPQPAAGTAIESAILKRKNKDGKH
mgnify:FL=1